MSKIDFNLATETITSGDNILAIGGTTGVIKVGSGSGVAASSAAGMIRWNGTNLQVSNGSAWLNVTATAAAAGSVTAEEAFAVAVALS